jgi:large subunit ribosomal protein L31e
MYKRANKAVKTLKEFIAQHMKIYDRDLRKVKVDIYLNNEIRFRGMHKPPAKIKVKAIKYEDGTVAVKLVQLPKHIEFELARKVRKEAEMLKKEEKKEKTEPKAEEKKEEKKEESKDTKEKEESSKIAMQAEEKKLAKEMKHTSGAKKEPEIKRKSLKR